MRTVTFLMVILSLVAAVSCGDDKKSKSSGLSSNPYKVSTVNAHYTPAKPQQIYYGGKWYQIQPMSQNAPMELQSVYQTTTQALSTASTQYRLSLVNNIPVFTVRVIGSLGGLAQPQQYSQQPYQQPVNTGVFSFQSIQLIK